MVIVVPAAGKSSRFPNMKPKYLLYDYKGDMMIKNAISPWLKNHEILIGILKEHDEKFEASEFLRKDIPEAKIIILENETLGPADTVYQILKKSGIETKTPLFIKDCDSFFDVDFDGNNKIVVADFQKMKKFYNAASKSYVKTTNQGIVLDIIEKQVISSVFCVGGYYFETIKKYMNTFESLSKEHKEWEIFVSHVISKMLSEGEIFQIEDAKNYIDVGTFSDWMEYNNKPTVFCDIDGTIIKAQNRHGKNSYNSSPKILKGNVLKIKKLFEEGAQIIFTTSRPEEYRTVTTAMLKSLGFNNFQLLMGLNNSQRILINDYSTHTPYPRATSINILRDSETLEYLL